QQADGVSTLLLGDRVRLPGAERLLPLDEADEALEVRAAKLLVRSREPGELAKIRVAAGAVVAREDGQVVVVLRQDALTEELEGRVRRELEEPVVALAEREQQAPVLLGQVTRQR